MKIFGVNPINTAKTNFAGTIKTHEVKRFQGNERAALEKFGEMVKERTNDDVYVRVYDMPESAYEECSGNLKLQYQDKHIPVRYFNQCDGFEYDPSEDPDKTAELMWNNLLDNVPSRFIK